MNDQFLNAVGFLALWLLGMLALICVAVAVDDFIRLVKRTERIEDMLMELENTVRRPRGKK